METFWNDGWRVMESGENNFAFEFVVVFRLCDVVIFAQIVLEFW